MAVPELKADALTRSIFAHSMFIEIAESVRFYCARLPSQNNVISSLMQPKLRNFQYDSERRTVGHEESGAGLQPVHWRPPR